jgi:hypothetical protein
LGVSIGVFIWEIIIKTWGYILRRAKNSDLMKGGWKI